MTAFTSYCGVFVVHVRDNSFQSYVIFCCCVVFFCSAAELRLLLVFEGGPLRAPPPLFFREITLLQYSC